MHGLSFSDLGTEDKRFGSGVTQTCGFPQVTYFFAV